MVMKLLYRDRGYGLPAGLVRDWKGKKSYAGRALDSLSLLLLPAYERVGKLLLSQKRENVKSAAARSSPVTMLLHVIAFKKLLKVKFYINSTVKWCPESSDFMMQVQVAEMIQSALADTKYRSVGEDGTGKPYKYDCLAKDSDNMETISEIEMKVIFEWPTMMKSLLDKESPDVIYLDLRKVLDLMPPDILLFKLERELYSPIQRVVVNGSESQWPSVTSGALRILHWDQR
ncbi:hypothetical protein TURU_020684 [Turdus rufiventris]|nr:hypothetical protein TURU_020684 [Turdus rufiventris]